MCQIDIFRNNKFHITTPPFILCATTNVVSYCLLHARNQVSPPSCEAKELNRITVAKLNVYTDFFALHFTSFGSAVLVEHSFIVGALHLIKIDHKKHGFCT